MAYVKCRDCTNLYSDRAPKCPECGGSFVVTDKAARDRALKSFNSERDMSIPGSTSGPANRGSDIQLKTLKAIRSIAIFVLFSFFSGVAFAFAAYRDFLSEVSFSSNEAGWIPWAFGVVLMLVGTIASSINLIASDPEK